ncbi:calcium/calmodulin-dependent protein kinase (CaM kinase) II gamma 1 isoform X2 [Tachysurus ichikawai]
MEHQQASETNDACHFLALCTLLFASLLIVVFLSQSYLSLPIILPLHLFAEACKSLLNKKSDGVKPQTNNTKNSVMSAVVSALKESNMASSTPMEPQTTVVHNPADGTKGSTESCNTNEEEDMKVTSNLKSVLSSQPHQQHDSGDEDRKLERRLRERFHRVHGCDYYRCFITPQLARCC